MLTLAEIIGDDLRTARIRAGLSQGQMADITGSHRPIIARLEAGIHAQDLHSLTRYAAALDLTVVELIGPALDFWENKTWSSQKRLEPTVNPSSSSGSPKGTSSA